MHPVDALVGALEAQVAVGLRLQPSQLLLDSPCPGWSVRDVLNHSIGTTSKFTDFAAGRTEHPRSPDGDLVGPDHRAALGRTVNTARAAWRSADMTRSCDLSFGTFSADHAAGINLFDVAAHTWDIAVATGTRFECPDDIWDAALDAARSVIGPDRDARHYAPAIACSLTAPVRDRFLAYLGRDPHETP